MIVGSKNLLPCICQNFHIKHLNKNISNPSLFPLSVNYTMWYSRNVHSSPGNAFQNCPWSFLQNTTHSRSHWDISYVFQIAQEYKTDFHTHDMKCMTHERLSAKTHFKAIKQQKDKVLANKLLLLLVKGGSLKSRSYVY